MVGVQTRLRIPLVRYILGFMAANTDLKMHWCRIKNIQRSCAFKRMKVCLKRLSRGALVAQLVKRVCLMHKRWVLTEAARVQNLTCSHRAACQLTLSSSFLPRYSYTIKWRYFKKKKKKRNISLLLGSHLTLLSRRHPLCLLTWKSPHTHLIWMCFDVNRAIIVHIRTNLNTSVVCGNQNWQQFIVELGLHPQ